MKIGITLAILAAAFCAQTANAHGIWTEQRYGHFEVVYGHGAVDEAYAADKIKGVWAYDQNGQQVPVTILNLSDHARLQPISAPAVLTVALDNGVWSKNKEGKSFNAPAAEVPDAVSTSHSYKYNLTIVKPHAQVPQHLKLAMVIRPLKDPMDVGVGNTLPVEVTIDGQPAANIPLFDDYRGMPDASNVKTDANGRTSIVIRNAGLNIIAAQAKIPMQGVQSSERSLFTSLTFVAEAHHH